MLKKINLFRKDTGAPTEILTREDGERIALIEYPVSSTTHHDVIVQVRDCHLFDCPACRSRVILQRKIPAGQIEERLQCDRCGVVLEYSYQENQYRAKFQTHRIGG
jgi:predicted RNA-binding Zn-ribbon protein involved in translation (DUF1610 family)